MQLEPNTYQETFPDWKIPDTSMFIEIHQSLVEDHFHISKDSGIQLLSEHQDWKRLKIIPVRVQEKLHLIFKWAIKQFGMELSQLINFLIGPAFLSVRLNGDAYRGFLKNQVNELL